MRNRVRHGWAWVLLSIALGVHVVDEAANDFLSIYNPNVARIKEVAPWLPLPNFTYAVWFWGLAAAVAALLSVAVFAFRGRRWIVLASFPYAAIMTLNALGHLTSSAITRRFLPGVYSSPLLLAASIYLWRTVRQLRTTGAPPLS